VAAVSHRHISTPPGETLELIRQACAFTICKSLALTDTPEHYPLLAGLPRSMTQTLSKPVNTRTLYRAVLQLLDGGQPAPALPVLPNPSRIPQVLCVDDQRSAGRRLAKES